MKYEIGGRWFRNKQAVIEYVKVNIYDVYPSHQPLSAEHLAFMVALLKRHPQDKIGCGVVEMWLESNPEYPNRTFHLRRTDGTTEDFSYRECVTPMSPRQSFDRGCRRAVTASILRFRDAFFAQHWEAYCPLTGESLTPNECHIDHTTPWLFKRIVDEFILCEGLDVRTVSLVGMDLPADMVDRFVAFHDERAKLRVLSRQGNLSLARASYATAA